MSCPFCTSPAKYMATEDNQRWFVCQDERCGEVFAVPKDSDVIPDPIQEHFEEELERGGFA